MAPGPEFVSFLRQLALGVRREETVRQSEMPEGGALTGWLCVIAGGLMAVFGALFAVAGWLVSALSEDGGDLLAQSGAQLDPLSRALLDHFIWVAGMLVVLGVASLVIGVQFLRMRPSARPALEILAWLVLVGSILVEIAALATSRQGAAGAGVASWISSPLTSLILTFLQILACYLVIRFLRSPSVRAAFQKDPTLPQV
jgi:hypothetical protein